ncbi:phage tail tube protein [Metabacillus sp. FJAT-53654]|uniref:Capsid protein n=1 Tax=Metabacillus rhizosphaerae TaxID=3117747 RepID=A0ABZ2MYL4_9BACI
MPKNVMNEHLFQIDTDTTGTTPALEAIGAGITNVAISNNEELDQTKYLDGDGFGETDVIGAQTVLAFTGHRDYGDPAQDFIFGKMLSIGVSRRVPFEWTEPDGGKYSGTCTIANISGPGGDAGSKGEISFEIHFNKRPTYTAGV